MAICPQQDADLHMARLMPVPLTISCFTKSRLVLPFWYRLTWVVPEKGPGVCVCQWLKISTQHTFIVLLKSTLPFQTFLIWHCVHMLQLMPLHPQTPSSAIHTGFSFLVSAYPGENRTSSGQNRTSSFGDTLVDTNTDTHTYKHTCSSQYSIPLYWTRR